MPKYVRDLIALYGPDREGLQKVAVFYEKIDPETNLERVALRYYRQYVGVYWERFGERNWMAAWELLYARPPGNKGDIVNEFKAVNDIYDILLMRLQLDSENWETAEQTLTTAYDHRDVIDLRIYQVGDTEAIVGRAIVGCRSNGETTIVLVSYG